MEYIREDFRNFSYKLEEIKGSELDNRLIQKYCNILKEDDEITVLLNSVSESIGVYNPVKEDDSERFIEDLESYLDEEVCIEIRIQKSVKNGYINVYSYVSFSDYLLEREIPKLFGDLARYIRLYGALRCYVFEEMMGYVLDRNNNVLLKSFLESVREERYVLSDEMFERLLNAIEVDEVGSWTNYLIGERIGANMTTSVRKKIVKQFNEKCKREILLVNILHPRYFDDLQKQDFTEESIQYLLDELLCSGLSKYILAQILVDEDVNEILLPLISRCKNEKAKSNVLNVIKLIGQKCQKRYLVVDNE